MDQINLGWFVSFSLPHQIPPHALWTNATAITTNTTTATAAKFFSRFRPTHALHRPTSPTFRYTFHFRCRVYEFNTMPSLVTACTSIGSDRLNTSARFFRLIFDLFCKSNLTIWPFSPINLLCSAAFALSSAYVHIVISDFPLVFILLALFCLEFRPNAIQWLAVHFHLHLFNWRSLFP